MSNRKLSPSSSTSQGARAGKAPTVTDAGVRCGGPAPRQSRLSTHWLHPPSNWALCAGGEGITWELLGSGVWPEGMPKGELGMLKLPSKFMTFAYTPGKGTREAGKYSRRFSLLSSSRSSGHPGPSCCFLAQPGPCPTDHTAGGGVAEPDWGTDVSLTNFGTLDKGLNCAEPRLSNWGD